MNQPLTIYTVKGKNFPNIWEFKYDLNGFLKEFKIIEGELSEKQIKWLFTPVRFPYRETDILSWSSINNIELIIGKPNLDFDTFYQLYHKKVGKLAAQKAWTRLNKTDQIKAISKIKEYKKYINRKHIQQADPATYLNKRRFDDEFNTVY